MKFTLELEAAELDLIGVALGKLPFDAVAPLMNKLIEQTRAQQEKPKLEAVPKEA